MMVPARWIGIPYLNRGSDFAGCDCWGLAWLFHREVLGQEIPRYEGYANASDPDEVSARIRAGWEGWQPVALPDVVLGDVLALRLGRHPVHVGIVINQTWMLHILEGRNSCLERYTQGMWKHAIVRIGRWKS